MVRQRAKRQPRRKSGRRESGSQPTSDGARYRRNRSLTPTSKPQSARQISHRQRRLRRRLALIFAGAAVATSLVTYLINQYTSSFTVSLATSDTAHSVKPVADSRYQKELTAYLDRHRWQRFRFALDKANLTRHLQQTHPEVKQLVAVTGKKVGHSTIDISFRQPIARWRIEDKTFFVDEKGVIFETNYFAKPEVEVVDRTRSFGSTDGAVASQRTLSFIGQAIASAGAQGVTVRKVEVPPASLRIVQLNLGRGVKARLTVDRPLEYQVEGLVVAHKHLNKQNQKPSYIDVRVPGKVFYK